MEEVGFFLLAILMLIGLGLLIWLFFALIHFYGTAHKAHHACIDIKKMLEKKMEESQNTSTDEQ